MLGGGGVFLRHPCLLLRAPHTRGCSTFPERFQLRREPAARCGTGGREGSGGCTPAAGQAADGSPRPGRG